MYKEIYIRRYGFLKSFMIPFGHGTDIPSTSEYVFIKKIFFGNTKFIFIQAAVGTTAHAKR